MSIRRGARGPGRAGPTWPGLRGGDGRAEARAEGYLTESQGREAQQIDRGSQQGEVGTDALDAADPGSAAAMAPAHEVRELAFDLGPNRSVVFLPILSALMPARGAEQGMLGVYVDAAATG